MIRRRRLAFAAVILAVGAALAPAGAPVASAAGDGLALTTSSTYTLVPAKRVVRVVVDVTARNNKANVVSGGVITKYFYDSFRLGIQTEATNIRASTGGTRLTLTTKPADGYQTIEVRFRSSLFFQQTAAVRLTFDLPGGAPRSASEVRVGPAFATFVAWAFGDSGSVRIVIPAGFEAETTGSELTRSVANGATILSAKGIVDAGSWYAVVNADRRSALTNSPITLADGEQLNVHAWPDDPVWKRQVTELLSKGLPELVDRTGLAWPVAGELSIFEVHTPLLEGYAGIFFEGQNKIEISEDLDDLTILHEASHAWFNSNLFNGRWINEGLADTFASESLGELALGDYAPDSVDPSAKASVPLNDWEFPGRITDDETDARESYGYNAAWTVIRTIYHEIGEAKFRAVLVAADAHQIPYVGAGTPETVNGVADWRRLLDLLDEVGGSTTADAQFRRWVVTEAEAKVLDERDAARREYSALVATAGDWSLPYAIRKPMSDWEFPTASDKIYDASIVLRQRDAITGFAAELGVPAPTDLRSAFEEAQDSFAEAQRIGGLEINAAQAVQAAIVAVDAPRDAIVSLGLMGFEPEARLKALLASFSAGSPTTNDDARALIALMNGATEVGQGRLVVGGVTAIAILLALMLLVLVDGRRRRRRQLALRAAAASAVPGPMAAPAEAGFTLPPDPEEPPPYATLADPTAAPDSTAEAPSAPPTDTGDAQLSDDR